MTYIEAITEVIGNLSTVTLPVRDVANINRINRSLDILEALKADMEKQSEKAEEETKAEEG